MTPQRGQNEILQRGWKVYTDDCEQRQRQGGGFGRNGTEIGQSDSVSDSEESAQGQDNQQVKEKPLRNRGFSLARIRVRFS